MSEASLFTQCLQKDFVQIIDVHKTLSNGLDIGYEESRRLIREDPREGKVMQLNTWAYGHLAKTNIRHWHNKNDSQQNSHLQQFGDHCLENTDDAEFVFGCASLKGRDPYQEVAVKIKVKSQRRQ